jgi:hypothetical protein
MQGSLITGLPPTRDMSRQDIEIADRQQAAIDELRIAEKTMTSPYLDRVRPTRWIIEELIVTQEVELAKATAVGQRRHVERDLTFLRGDPRTVALADAMYIVLQTKDRITMPSARNSRDFGVARSRPWAMGFSRRSTVPPVRELGCDDRRSGALARPLQCSPASYLASPRRRRLVS